MLCNLSELSPKHFNTINVSFKDCIFVFPSFRWKCVIFKSLIDNGQVRLIDCREGWKTIVEYYEENIVESHFFLLQRHENQSRAIWTVAKLSLIN